MRFDLQAVRTAHVQNVRPFRTNSRLRISRDIVPAPTTGVRQGIHRVAVISPPGALASLALASCPVCQLPIPSNRGIYPRGLRRNSGLSSRPRSSPGRRHMSLIGPIRPGRRSRHDYAATLNTGCASSYDHFRSGIFFEQPSSIATFRAPGSKQGRRVATGRYRRPQPSRVTKAVTLDVPSFRWARTENHLPT